MHSDRLLQQQKYCWEQKAEVLFCIAFLAAANLKYLHNQQKMFVQDGHVQDMRKRFLSLYLKTSLIRAGRLLQIKKNYNGVL